jgi:hypothetical protein
MADPLTVFANFAIVPADGATGITLTSTMEFNCDLTGGTIRSTYQENRYNMRFVVNAETVYESPSGSGKLWSGSTGGSRHVDSPNTPGNSYGIWYTLTTGQGDLAYGLTYTWSVDLKYYGDSVWTEVISGEFTVQDEPTPPLAPITPTPANHADTVVSTTHVLSWVDGGSGAHAATSYDVYFADEFVDTVTDPTIDLTDYSIALEADTEYSWRVDATNSFGTTTGTGWDFTTISANIPEKPTNPSPANSAPAVKFTQATLSWTDPGAGTAKAATSFDVRIGLVNDESMIVIASGSETTVAISVTMLPTLFYWRVDATNSYGTTTGTTWTFTVDDDPIRNKQDSGAWHPGGTYTVEAYAPDSNVGLILSSNDSLDATGEIQGVTFGVLRRLDSQWAVYNVTIPFDCDTGSMYLKWNYNDE